MPCSSLVPPGNAIPAQEQVRCRAAMMILSGKDARGCPLALPPVEGCGIAPQPRLPGLASFNALPPPAVDPFQHVFGVQAFARGRCCDHRQGIRRTARTIIDASLAAREGVAIVFSPT